MNATPTQYEVALSFAGEQREYAEDVARALQTRGVAVYYDRFQDLWGKDLVEELNEVFELRAAHVVMFISSEYVEKAWPRHERRSTLSRAIRERGEYVLPVRFDDTVVPGLPTGLHYEWASAHTPAELASKIAEKIGVNPFHSKASDVPPPRTTSLIGSISFDYSSHNGCYVIGRDQLEFETKWSKASNTSIHMLNDPRSIHGLALAKDVGTIDSIADARSLDYTSRVRTPRLGQVVVLQNIHRFYAAVQILGIKDDTRGDYEDEIRFRYVIQADGSDDFRGTL